MFSKVLVLRTLSSLALLSDSGMFKRKDLIRRSYAIGDRTEMGLHPGHELSSSSGIYFCHDVN